MALAHSVQHVFVQLSSFHYNSYVINIYKTLAHCITEVYMQGGMSSRHTAVFMFSTKCVFFIIQCTNK